MAFKAPCSSTYVLLFISQKRTFLPLERILKARYSSAAVPSINSLQLGTWTDVVKAVHSPESPKPKRFFNLKDHPRSSQEL